MRKYKLTINDTKYEVSVKEVTDQIARVEVNGEEHTVSIDEIKSLELPESIPRAEKPVTARPAAMAAALPQTPFSGGVVAPMPGQIKAIFVREGDNVKIGQKLLNMEAMKLENKIAANRDGVIKKILVRDGDIVSQGQELVVIV